VVVLGGIVSVVGIGIGIVLGVVVDDELAATRDLLTKTTMPMPMPTTLTLTTTTTTKTTTTF
jgi:hypothetical protein